MESRFSAISKIDVAVPSRSGDGYEPGQKSKDDITVAIDIIIPSNEQVVNSPRELSRTKIEALGETQEAE